MARRRSSKLGIPIGSVRVTSVTKTVEQLRRDLVKERLETIRTKDELERATTHALRVEAQLVAAHREIERLSAEIARKSDEIEQLYRQSSRRD